MQIKHILTLALLFCLCALPLAAQITTGGVQGKVADSSGAVVPLALAELINKDTNVSYKAETGDTGIFVFNLVPPGNYKLRVSFKSFRTSEITGVIVEIGRTTIIDVTIHPGEVTELVEVSAALENIDTQSTSVNANMESWC
jgi:hypothetical protein